MRKIASLFAATIFVAGLVAFTTPASALTFVPAKPIVSGSTDLQPVGWRCGPGRHVNRWGRCVRN